MSHSVYQKPRDSIFRKSKFNNKSNMRETKEQKGYEQSSSNEFHNEFRNDRNPRLSNVEIEKRSMEEFRESPTHNYFVFPTSNCKSCKEIFSTANTKIAINKAIPIDKNNSLRENIEQENRHNIEIHLVVKKKQQSYDSEYKLIDVEKVNFLGPFSLFDQLYMLISRFSGDNRRYSPEMQGGFKEILEHSLDHRLLQLNINSLRLEYREIFWNLIYLFSKDGINYKFICPYKSDLPSMNDPEEFSTCPKESMIDKYNPEDDFIMK